MFYAQSTVKRHIRAKQNTLLVLQTNCLVTFYDMRRVVGHSYPLPTGGVYYCTRSVKYLE